MWPVKCVYHAFGELNMVGPGVCANGAGSYQEPLMTLEGRERFDPFIIYCARRMRYKGPLGEHGGSLDIQMKSVRLAHGAWCRSLSPSVIGHSITRRLFGTGNPSATHGPSPRRAVAAGASLGSMGQERLAPRASYVSGRNR